MSLETLVFRHLELRSILQRRRVGKRQPTTESQLLHIKGCEDTQLFLSRRGGVRVTEELLANLVVDLTLVRFDDHVLGSLAGPETRQLSLLLEAGGHGVKGGVDLLDGHLDAEELLARTQILDGNVHVLLAAIGMKPGRKVAFRQRGGRLRTVGQAGQAPVLPP